MNAMLSLEDTKSEVSWASSDAEIAAVSQEGVVKALQPGEAEITMTDEAGEQIIFTVKISAEDNLVLDLEDDNTLLPTIDEFEIEVIPEKKKKSTNPYSFA